MDELLDEMSGPFALAYRDAERRKAEAEAAEAAAATAELERLATEHVYDPRPYPEAEPADMSLYVGTGIGALYGLPNHEEFLAELGDWTLGKEPS